MSWIAPFRGSLVGGILLSAVLPMGTFGQQSEANYSARVNATWGEGAELADRPTEERQALARATLNRAEFLGDVTELAIRLGNDYGMLRDTADAVAATPANPVYTGIHLALSGHGDDARQHLNADLDLPGELDEVQSGWARIVGGHGDGPTAPSGSPASWGGLVRAVKEDGSVCPAPDQASLRHGRCVIHRGIAEQSAALVRDGQRFLESRSMPDHVDRVGEDLRVEFHDASTFVLLELSDWWIAARALEGESDPGIRLAAASALVRAGQPGQALEVLEGLDDPVAEVQRAAAQAGSGNLGTAEERWRAVVDAGGDPALMALDQMSRYGLGDGLAGERYEADAAQDFAGYSRRRALLLARALIRQDEPERALHVLESQYPRSAHNDLTRIPPEFLVTMAHARYLAGRDHYPQAREHLVVLAGEYPVMRGLMAMMQEITAPERTRSERSRPSH